MAHFIKSILIFLTLAFYPLHKGKGQLINYQIVDESPDHKEKTDSDGMLDNLGIFTKPAHWITEGIYWENNRKTWKIGSVGLWSTVPVYNFVDGFWLGQTLSAIYQENGKEKLRIEPMIYYATARKAMVWSVDATLQYAPHMKGKMVLSGGDVAADYDTEEHLARLENSLYSLVLGRNYMKLYRKRFVEVRNNFFPFPGVRVFGGLSFQWRSTEENHTTYSFIHTDYNQSNIPDNKRFRYMPHNKALVGSIGFDYTLCRLSHMKESTNEIIYSEIPTLSAEIDFGIPVGSTNQSSFSRINVSLNQRFKFKRRTTLDYKIGGGAFLTKHNLWFPDFKHFGAYSLPSMRTFTNDGYFLIGYYNADTDESWLKGSANFMSEHFLLTRLKFLDNGDFSEGLHARYLWTSQIRQYHEWGYSIGYKNLFRAGVFVGFKQMKYSNFGFTVSFPWLTGGY